jgi:hypothetical protein
MQLLDEGGAPPHIAAYLDMAAGTLQAVLNAPDEP